NRQPSPFHLLTKPNYSRPVTPFQSRKNDTPSPGTNIPSFLQWLSLLSSPLWPSSS
ncbi:hypothetical protein COCCADRAFT_105148, partial [Bipolaris zeicola 26-R-13]